jgi:hypothetical protein
MEAAKLRGASGPKLSSSQRAAEAVS